MNVWRVRYRVQGHYTRGRPEITEYVHWVVIPGRSLYDVEEAITEGLDRSHQHLDRIEAAEWLGETANNLAWKPGALW